MGLSGLPARIAARPPDPAGADRGGRRFGPGTRSALLLLALSVAASLVVVAIGAVATGASAGGWAGLAFLAGAIPSVGIGLGTGLVEATGASEVEGALSAGLGHRALTRAGAAGREIAALVGGAALVGFAAVFVLSGVSVEALSAYLAGTIAVPVLAAIVLGRTRERLPGRAVVPDPEPGLPRPSGTTRRAWAVYELLAAALAGSTIVLEQFPLAWSLFSDALLLPLLVVAVGLWASLVGSWLGELGRGEVPLRAAGRGVVASIALSMVAALGALVGIGGDETALWGPAAVGVVLVEIVGLCALLRRSAGRRASTAGPAVVLGLAVVGTLGAAFALAAEPFGGTVTGAFSIGWLGVVVAAVASAAWAPSVVALETSRSVYARGASAAAGAIAAARWGPLETEEPTAPWAPRLADGYRAVASATTAVVALVAVLYLVPFRDAVPPSAFAARLVVTDPALGIGAAVGLLVAAAFAHPGLGALGGRIGRAFLVGDALLAVGLLLGPVGLVGLVAGGTAGGFGLSLREIARPPASAGAFASPEAGAPPAGCLDDLTLFVRALPAGALLLVALFLARLSLGAG